MAESGRRVRAESEAGSVGGGLTSVARVFNVVWTQSLSAGLTVWTRPSLTRPLKQANGQDVSVLLHW